MTEEGRGCKGSTEEREEERGDCLQDMKYTRESREYAVDVNEYANELFYLSDRQSGY